MSESRSDHRGSKPPPKREWPPQFESAGAAYIFDSRSGFFYEASSDFFYDPKTKLYYGNKKGKYYEYCKGETPRFRAVSQLPGDASSLESESTLNNSKDDAGKRNDRSSPESDRDPTSNGSAKPEKKDKKKIAICIKKKFTDKTEKTSEPPKPASASPQNQLVPSQIQKKHAADIDKWTVRTREMRDAPADPGTSPSDPPSSTPNPPSQKTCPIAKTSKNPSPTKTTTSGQPVCMLCKRKFGDRTKLKQHIEHSALHKQNLAKKAAADAAKSSAPLASLTTTEYRDRAKERRVMYGPETASTANEEEPATVGPSLTTARTVTATESIRPDENLGDSNIGNQMLQKLGWKKGESLGQQKSCVGEKLKEDWETIEALASSNGKREYGPRAGGGGFRAF
mmetsp:Transcript_18327/g.22733  ORF Transcript_18327/g.22733 Transcript_18327/m.22733 type:complete len:396 (-) Transcript_18327:142-1329(-)